MSKIRAIFDELSEAGHGDGWYAWATNQAAHAVVIGWPLGFVAVWCGLSPVLTPVVVGIAYFAIWEMLVQWETQKGPRDALADTFFVSLGGALVVCPWSWPIFIIALAIGVWRRV